MSKRPPSPSKNRDPSRNPDGTFKSREEYERAMEELHNPRPHSHGFARTGTALSRDVEDRQSHYASEAELRRIEEMQRPTQRSNSPQGRSGMMSTTMARYRAREAEFERIRLAQLAFYAMLEQRYGAIPGDDDSYLVAMERYDYDMEKERKKKEKVAAGTMMAFQSEAEMEAMIKGLDDEVRERLRKATVAHQRADSQWRDYDREKTRREEAEIERLRQEAERLRREFEARQEHERRRREEESRQYQERERQRRQREEEQERRYQEQQRQQRYQEQQQRQQRQQQHQHQHQGQARGARAASPPRRDEPESPKSALVRRYPVPETRPAAFAVLGLPPTANPREIKKAYHHGAMALHPDKNPNNQDEAVVRFQQLERAYSLLNPQGGGRRRRHRRSRHHKSHKTHKTHHHRHGKTHRRCRRKTHRRK